MTSASVAGGMRRGVALGVGVVGCALVLGAGVARAEAGPAVPGEVPSVPVVPPPPAEAGASVSVAGGEGLRVTSADGRYALALRAWAQLRLTETVSATAPRVDDWQVRRARLSLKGRVYDERIKFAMQLGLSPGDLETDVPSPLRDFHVTFEHVRDAQLRVGQMKVPFDRQRFTSSQSQQFADRSLVTQELNLDRDVGLQLFSTDLFGLGGRLGYQLGVFAGDGRNRTGTTPGLLAVARVEWFPFGAFDDDVESDLAFRPEPRLAVGLGAAINANTNRPRSTFGVPLARARFTYTHAEADLTAKWRGLSLSAAALVRQADRPVDVGGPAGLAAPEWSRSAWGFFVQGGWLFQPAWELVARYGDFRPLGEADPTLVRTRELGGGLNWYVSGHDLKVMNDGFWIAGTDLSKGRFQWRTQLQLAF